MQNVCSYFMCLFIICLVDALHYVSTVQHMYVHYCVKKRTALMIPCFQNEWRIAFICVPALLHGAIYVRVTSSDKSVYLEL